MAGFARTVDCRRTTRRQLRLLRRVTADLVLVDVIDAALLAAGD
ncbi:MAG TPA: hypothetical protein VIN58_09230 [Roseateles sp.]